MKEKLKSEKGAITLIVLVAMLFLTTFLMSVYINVANKARTSAETTNQIAQKYNQISQSILNESPLIFEVENEKAKVVMDREGTTLNFTVKIFNENMLYSMDNINYQIYLEESNKFKIVSQNEEVLHNKLYKTIGGGEAKSEEISLRLNAVENAVLDSEETIILIIEAFSPYKKTIRIPVNINTNPSTMSGIELNFLIKNGSYAPEGDVYEYYSVDANRMKDETIKKIVFGKYNDYKTKVTGITAEPIDVNRIGIINLYRVLNSDNTTYTIYILSEDGTFELGENAAWTFDKLYALEGIENLHLLNTSKVTNMRDMFCDCAAITNVDLSNFDTGNVTDMIGMFARMKKIQYLDLTTFNTQSLITINNMFHTCPLLKSIYVSNKWDLSNIEEGTGVFSSCSNLIGEKGTVYDKTKLDYTMAVIDGTKAGYLTSQYNFLDGLNVNHVIKAKTATEVNGWDINDRYADTTVISITFGRTKDYFSVIEGYTGAAVDEQKSGAIQVYRIPNSNGTYSVYIISNSGIFNANEDSSWMFDKLYKLTAINNLDLLNTSKVTNMRDMFCDCASLPSLDLSSFETVNLQSLQGTFARMYSIKTLDLSSFNTKNVTTMLNMFVLSISPTETLEEFQNVTPALQTIYVSNLWNTSSITTVNEVLFANNTNLKGGAGTTFNASNATLTYARIDTASTPGYLTLK